MVRLMHGTSKLPCSTEPTVYPLPLSDACAFCTSDALRDANFGSMPPFCPSARVTAEPPDVVVDRRAAISLTLKMPWCSPRSLPVAAPGVVSPGPSFSSAPDLGLCGGMSAHSSTRSASVNQAQIAAERCVTCLPMSSASVDGRDRRVATCATVSVSSSLACTPLGCFGGGNDSNLSNCFQFLVSSSCCHRCSFPWPCEAERSSASRRATTASSSRSNNPRYMGLPFCST